MRQKGIVLIPLLVVIAIIFLVIFLSYQKDNIKKVGIQSTPTSSNDNDERWMTYTNNKYGYEFQYPKGWTITEKPVSEPDPKTGIAKTSTEIDFTNNGKISFISINAEGGRNLNVNPKMIKNETNIGGVKATLYSFSPDTGFKFYGYFDSEKYPEFSITIQDSTKTNSNVIQKFLSSFKFTI